MEPLTPDDPPAIGPYRLLGRLGRGGMGRVYLGRSAGGRTVAVKVVHKQFASDERFRARFAREVDAARLVGGAWTAPVLDADPGAELPWVATGYVAGPDLQQAVADHGPLPEHTVRALAAGLAEALAAVHARGLVHRDVKPSNVLLALDGPRLIDFGVARAGDASAVLTATGVAVGSPGYMAPEQVMGASETGPPGDVFSCGAVLAYAASGRAPFPGDSAAQLLYRVVHEPPELDGVPGTLRPLIAACLEKDPTRRPTPAAIAHTCTGPGGATTLIRPGWLPPPVVETVSRRAVELLDAEAQPLGAPPGAGPASPGGGRGEAAVGRESTAPGVVWPSPQGPGGGGSRRWRWRWAVVGAAGLVVGAVAVGAFLLGGDGGDEGREPRAGGGSPSPTAVEDDALPDRFVGEWEGDITIDPGVPGGTMVIVLEPGRVGEEIGTATGTDAVGLVTCVDRLTLSEVGEEDGEEKIVFDAEPDPDRTNEFACSQGEFRYTIEPRGEDAIQFSTDSPDGRNRGVLDRQS